MKRYKQITSLNINKSYSLIDLTQQIVDYLPVEFALKDVIIDFTAKSRHDVQMIIGVLIEEKL